MIKDNAYRWTQRQLHNSLPKKEGKNHNT